MLKKSLMVAENRRLVSKPPRKSLTLDFVNIADQTEDCTSDNLALLGTDVPSNSEAASNTSCQSPLFSQNMFCKSPSFFSPVSPSPRSVLFSPSTYFGQFTFTTRTGDLELTTHKFKKNCTDPSLASPFLSPLFNCIL